MTESISRKFSRLGLGVSETGTLTVNSATATKWATARTLTLSGDLSGNVNIDGSENVTLTATVSGNTVALGTDTTGDYVASVTAGTGITTTGTGEGAAVTVAIDSTVTTLTGTQTLTNKTISGSNNTITNIGNGSLTNSSITINGASIALGASGTLVTDDVAEDASPVNLWFTNTRARNAVSATDAGGDGSFTYDSGTGVFTYTGPSATEVRAHLSAGTGLTYTTGQFSIDSTVVTLTGTQTLSNKTLTSPVISSISNTGTLTLPTSTDTLVGRATTDTFTNKTISGADNTISNIGNASLTNSSITINGTSVSLGGTRTLVTDDIAEDGSPTNLWYTDARTRAAISVTDAGGDGSLGYNSGTGVITYTGPSATEVRAHFSAGTGVTITNGQVAIGQAVATTDNVTFAGVTADNVRVGVTAAGEIDTSTGNLTVDSAGGTTVLDDDVNVTGNMTIDGNLTVSGTTVTVNATNLAIEDNMIYLNSGSTVSHPDLGFAGNYNDGTYRHAGLFRDESDGRWKFFHQYTPEPDASAYIDITHASFALAPVQASSFIGSVTGNVTGNASTATTWQTARTLSLTGDVTGTSAAFDGSGNISISTTIAADSVALGTDTTGNYVASITNGNYITGGNGGSEGAALTLAVDATSANTASKVVARDASGNFSAGTITATLSGNASTVTNGVYTTDTGTVTNTMLAGSIANNKLANSTISGVALGSNLGTLTLGVSGTGLSGSQTYNGSGAATFTVTSNATSANTGSTIVARDGNGDFSGRYIFGVHFNQSSPNDENPSIAAFWTNSSADNYNRKATPAHVISQLGLLTTSNYSSYALPLAGGTMTGAIVMSQAADWYMYGLGTRGASAGAYGIGLTSDIANRTLSFHVPNHAAYSSSGAVPKFGWYSNGADELMTLQSATGNLVVKGNITTSGRYIVGTFPNSTVNSSEAWIGRATDRSTGTLTVQLGNSADRYFEIVDKDWTTVIFAIGMNTAPSYKGSAMLTAGNYNSYAPTLTGTGASGTWGINISGNAATATTASQLGGVAASNYFRSDGTYPNADFNTVVEGYWHIASGSSNLPINEYGHRWDWDHLNNGQWVFQMYSPTSSDASLWIRQIRNYVAQSWRRVLDSSNYSSILDSRYLYATSSPSTAGNFTLSIGNNGSYSYVQSHSSQPLELNPVGNAVRIAGNVVLHAGNYSSYALPLSGGSISGQVTITPTLAWNNATAALNVGGASDARIQVRHIWGKDSSTAGVDSLWLQYANTGYHVQVGASGGGNNLYVSGNIYANGYFGGNLVLHAGNYSSYALPLSGGTVTGQFNTTNKRSNFGEGTFWDAAGFSGGQTNVHMQGHDHFWIGAGNAYWYRGAINTEHDLLITTMYGYDSTSYYRGITFAVENTGAGNSGYRLGRWQTYGTGWNTARLQVDASLCVGYGARGTNSDYLDYDASYWPVDRGVWRHGASETGYGARRGYIFSPDIGGHSGGPWGSFVSLEVSTPYRAGTLDIPALFRIHQWGSGSAEFWKPLGTVLYLRESPSGGSIKHGSWFTKFLVERIIESDESVRGPIFYDSNDTAYYTDPNGTSILYNLNLNGAKHTYLNINPGNGYEAMVYYNGGGSGSPWYVGKRTSNDLVGTGEFHFYSVAAGQTVGGIDTSGNFTARANVTAYSDIRVKKNIQRIDNALEKVNKINGYTFERTDIQNSMRQAGVIAQEVLEVLPEVVLGSEETHYFVAYGNMVGLLIEAIKEQQAKIEELERRINNS